MTDKIYEVLCEPFDVEIGVKGLDEILQCVRTIITTRRGEVFGDRAFGIDSTVSDIETHVKEQIHKSEQRVEVIAVNLNDNKTLRSVKVKIKAEK